MSANPRLSIIIPTYNGAAYVGQTLQSIQDQTFGDWECVVVNDGSTDETGEVVQAFADKDGRFRVIDQANQGAAVARNTGVEAMALSADYIVFHDGDDLYEPHALEALLEGCLANPDCIGAHGVAEMIDSEGAPMPERGFARWFRERQRYHEGRIQPCPIDAPTTFEVMITQSIYPPGVFMIKRGIVERTGPMDSEFVRHEDWDYMIRVSRYGPIVFLNDVILGYRQHDNNATKSLSLVHRYGSMIHTKSFFSTKNTPEQQETMKGFYRAWQRHKINNKYKSLRASLKRGDIMSTARWAVHIVGHACRWVRGYPK